MPKKKKTMLQATIIPVSEQRIKKNCRRQILHNSSHVRHLSSQAHRNRIESCLLESGKKGKWGIDVQQVSSFS